MAAEKPEKQVSVKDTQQLMDVAGRLGNSSKDLLQKRGEKPALPNKQEIGKAIETAKKLE